jgi:hypothetical protein
MQMNKAITVGIIMYIFGVIILVIFLTAVEECNISKAMLFIGICFLVCLIGIILMCIDIVQKLKGNKIDKQWILLGVTLLIFTVLSVGLFGYQTGTIMGIILICFCIIICLGAEHVTKGLGER